MGSRLSNIWRRRSNQLNEMSDNERSAASSSNNIDESDGIDEEEQSLRLYLALAVLRGGRYHFHFEQNERTEALINTPCPDKIQESDLERIILLNQGFVTKPTLSKRYNVSYSLRQRELNCSGTSTNSSFSQGNCVMLSSRYIPNQVKKEVKFEEKNFCGIYSDDGNLFLSACQDSHIRIYDSKTFGKTSPLKDIAARDVGWSVIDVTFTCDSRFFAYSSWSQHVHMCSVFDHGDLNMAQHEALLLNPGDLDFAVFSLHFAKDGSEILCGAKDGCIYTYDLEQRERALKVDAHEDDINAVCYADDSSQIFYSGGDDGLVKVWDRRCLSCNAAEPVGMFAGHQDGITFIDSRGDARYLISNSKDQSIKLWDIRCFSSSDAVENVRQVVSRQTWDYRWERAPSHMRDKKKLTIPGDTSVFTYTGHKVMNTLIRARFSPLHSTGNKYIYTGCATGKVLVYDVLTGDVVAKLPAHSKCVRDVSWHPYENNLMTSSWEGSVKLWHWKGTDQEEEMRNCL